MGALLRLILNPCFSGPVLFATGFPLPILHDVLVRYLSVQTVELVARVFLYLFILGLLSFGNGILNKWADNKWRWKTDDKAAWNWPNEVAVVTGGSNGIGALVARMLAQRQIKVAILDVQPLGESLKGVANIKHYNCDLRSREAVATAAKSIREDLGAPSVLINNAGIGHAHDILEATPEALRAMFDINLIAHWFTIQEFMPDMLSRKKGHIMSVASMASFACPAGMVEYGCAKAGLLALHEGLNQELKHRYGCPEIKTTIVHPSWTRTRLIGPLEADLRKAGTLLLEADFVAGRMVRQILEARSGQLILPECMSLAAGLRGFPTWLQELIRDRTNGFVRAKGSSLGV